MKPKHTSLFVAGLALALAGIADADFTTAAHALMADEPRPAAVTLA